MKVLSDLFDDFLVLLYPRICAGCGEHLLRNESFICTGCHLEIPRTNYHIINDNPVEQLFWGRCLIERGSAFSFYTRGSRIRKIVHNIKYRGMKELGTEMGRIYAAALKGTDFLKGIDLIVPVPLHPGREKKRGYNQSVYICNGISEITGIPVNSTSLKRTNKSDTQTRRSRYERWQNVEGIFNIEDPAGLAGKHILLVDDVITTGSTLEACVNELLKVSDLKVSVAALAVAVM